MNNYIEISELVSRFKMLKQVAGGKQALKKRLFRGLIIQPGFEMSGFMFPEYSKHIFLFRQREKKYAQYAMDKQRFEKVFNEFIKHEPICLIFDHDYICPDSIKKMANENNVAVLQVSENEFSISYHLQNYLSEVFAPTIEVHASCLSIYGCGVLIQGPSGIGKSESTLELIKRKHLFVCDDRVVLKRTGNRIMGSSPIITKNLMEVRGIGILNVKMMFGVQACTDNVRIDLITKLTNWDPTKTIDRLGDKLTFENILNVPIQYYEIPVRQGRIVSELIETAVIGFLLRKEGINTTEDLNNRLKKYHASKKE